MNLPALTAGRFVRRDNRFQVTVTVAGELAAAHLPSSGRLTELLTPRRLCWLTTVNGPRRRTRFDLKLVGYAGTLISVDARLPNSLFAEALAYEQLEPFQGYDCLASEVRRGSSRLDFRLRGPEGSCWVEVKSVTLVKDGAARFPDAPTKRGARHLLELARAVEEGDRAAAIFVIQRADACCFAPNDRADQVFGEALRAAVGAGVDVYAWTCQVSRQAIVVARRVPVDLT